MTLQFNKDGLIPVIVQDVYTNEVLMLAYMNQEAYTKTIDTKEMVYYSRSRQTLWKKGETSGNIQRLTSLSYDCDEDTLLAKVEQVGAACHTGNKTCFYRDVYNNNRVANDTILPILFNVIKQKQQNPDGGYTNYLFEKGIDKILKKVGEEASEVIIASKNNNEETIYEISDLFYHLLVLMVNNGIELSDIFKELSSRRK
ncbi:MAG: bifunctional phosphoribosyl-AMP cyclohydrolase/phosphoribosyl-ATP diphosphatase HisIE [Candidatus Izemoplasma sp.]|nr:bifunctional phosphoribosyl-AMP cyclohydrolase/phosphoribosyl-ATP diphosphatase HisIE [Candidatus Izemoplasma sp.]